MCTSARSFNCQRCQALTLICSHCDRGQQYCSSDCSEQARRDSHKRANQKYSQSRRGRFNNALRQQRHRQRHQQKVTDQGSPPEASTVSLSLPVITAVLALFFAVIKDKWSAICHFCHRQINPLWRHDFLHRQSIDRRG